MARADAQLTVRLPRTLQEHLARAAAANGHTPSEEVRLRLIASFDRAAPPVVTDPKTQALLRVISRMAYDLSEWFAPWHEDPFAAHVLRLAVDKTLAAQEPEGEPTPKPRPGFEEFGRATLELLAGVLSTFAIRELKGQTEERANGQQA